MEVGPEQADVSVELGDDRLGEGLSDRLFGGVLHHVLGPSPAERVGHLGHEAVDPAVLDHLMDPVQEQVPVIGRVQGSI